VPAIGVAPATGTASWKNAHDMVSLSDVSADPNRAMVLIYAHREHGARP
jgi:hypothetical protein